jgi:hypothetical protein
MSKNGSKENKMASAVIFMQWDSYESEAGEPVFFRHEPLTFSSRQERLHKLGQGDRLWLVSRCPADQQYYFVAMLTIAGTRRNAPDSPEAEFGEFGVILDRSRSKDLGKSFSADGLLRAFEFETGKPIKYGASIGQSLQTLRILHPDDGRILDRQFQRLDQEGRLGIDRPFGLWTKCDRVFADYFRENWNVKRQPLAFMLYDPPPALGMGSPIFIHSDKNLRLVARFITSQYLSGHKFTAEKEERLAERERFWNAYRANTLNPPAKDDFDRFWEKQNGVRALFMMDTICGIPEPIRFRVYGRALEWGYPTGVGYRYITLPQSLLLLRAARLEKQFDQLFLQSLLQ